MGWRPTLKWLLEGVWHAAVCFYSAYFLWPSMGQDGEHINTLGSVVGFNCVLVANVKVNLTPKRFPFPFPFHFRFSLCLSSLIQMWFDFSSC